MVRIRPSAINRSFYIATSDATNAYVKRTLLTGYSSIHWVERRADIHTVNRVMAALLPRPIPPARMTLSAAADRLLLCNAEAAEVLTQDLPPDSRDVTLLINQLARCCDNAGVFSLESVKKKYPHIYRILTEEFEHILPAAHGALDRLSNQVASNSLEKYGEALTRKAPSLRALTAMYRGETHLDLLSDMPALTQTAAPYLSTGRKPLADMYLGLCQHLFPSVEPLVAIMRKLGLEQSKTLILGKPHSTDPRVHQRLVRGGWAVCEQSIGELRYYGFDVMPRELAKLFERAGRDTTVYFIDKGARWLGAVTRHFPHQIRRCVFIEQTDAGMQRLEPIRRAHSTLPFRVVDVARCRVKKELESPMIALGIITKCESALRKAHRHLTIPQHIGIIGYGAVGSEMAKSLKDRGRDVYVFDSDPSRAAVARRDGCQWLERQALLAKAQMLVSVTGQKTLHVHEYGKLPKGAILLNAANSFAELGADELGGERHLNESAPFSKLGLQYTNFETPSGSVAIQVGRGAFRHRVINGRLLLHGGFTDQSEDLPHVYIQLTRGLMLTALLQVRDGGLPPPGVTPLDPKREKAVEDATEAHLREIGAGPLKHPNFSGLSALLRPFYKTANLNKRAYGNFAWHHTTKPTAMQLAAIDFERLNAKHNHNLSFLQYVLLSKAPIEQTNLRISSAHLQMFDCQQRTALHYGALLSPGTRPHAPEVGAGARGHAAHTGGRVSLVTALNTLPLDKTLQDSWPTRRDSWGFSAIDYHILLSRHDDAFDVERAAHAVYAFCNLLRTYGPEACRKHAPSESGLVALSPRLTGLRLLTARPMLRDRPNKLSAESKSEIWRIVRHDLETLVTLWHGAQAPWLADLNSFISIYE